ncbi:SDR family oxidoreductase [Croceibacterium ferulae]|uniref:SDR family oxidoreductase n=1 Tax=Croceibacterium ferulae TaxID=1854641 RepID=UPI000EAB4D27|nr:SDR family oxidoreductase [Croceibacterium ferulae]
MNIFLTGATGFVGSHIIPELLAAGHCVTGLTRSEAGARRLAEAGAEPYRGSIGDLASLRAGIERADGVIHTAFDHNFAEYRANCEKDGRVIATMGEVLQGSDRPLLITSATVLGDNGDGRPAVESAYYPDHPIPRIATEQAGEALLQAGVDLRIIRLPQVHDPVKQGLVTPYIDHARQTGTAAYVDDGAQRWCAGHVGDVARLYALALDRGQKGARYHAVAEEGVPFRSIAEAVARGLDLPLVSLSGAAAQDHFGWLSMFVGLDKTASSTWTQEQLGWQPVGPGLIADLDAMDYADRTVPAM